MIKRFFVGVFLMVFMITMSSQSFVEAKNDNQTVNPMVTAGFSSSAVLKEDGTVWCFGNNTYGECGNGKTGDTAQLTKVYGLSDVIAIDSADAYTLALKKDGTVWAWGENYFYEQGSGKARNILYASPIVELTGIKGIAAGNGFSFYLKEDGSVCYLGGYHYKASALTKLKGLSDIIAIACKHTRAIALRKDGTVFTWYWDYKGDGVKQTSILHNPIRQTGITGVKAINAGDFHYIAVKKDETVWIWGGNSNGQIGDGTRNNRNTPMQVRGVSNPVAIAAGSYFTMVSQKDGTYWAWGNNECGQYGNGTKKTSYQPVKVSGLTNVVCMDGGMEHTVALRSNGDVVVMGNNYHGVLGTGDRKDKLRPYKIMNVKDKDSLSDKGIYPNGDLSDWETKAPLAQGEVTSDDTKRKGIEELYAAKDSKYLYIAAKVSSGLPVGQVYKLDYNGDGDADYDICFSYDDKAGVYLFKHDGKSAKLLKAEGYGIYTDVYEVKVPLSYIGNPKVIRITAYFGLSNADKLGINAEVGSWQKVPSL